MSARDVIEGVLRSATVVQSGESVEMKSRWIVSALEADGYRILAPGELDSATVEKVADFAKHDFQRDFESPIGWRDQFSTAIRNLKDRSAG